MLECPKNTHRIHKFKYHDEIYVADIDRYCVIEISPIAWDILELCSSHNNEQLIECLIDKYDKEQILTTLEDLGEIERNGLIFSSAPEEGSKGVNVFIHGKSIYYPYADIASSASGATITHHHLIRSLTNYVDVHIMSDEAKEIDDKISGVPFDLKSIEHYDGIMAADPFDWTLLPYLRYIDVPVIVPIYALRGQGGKMINAILTWYAAMKDFDGFLVPTTSVKECYSQFVYDTSCFYHIPLGVDSDHFKPMDKKEAKKTVAEMLNDSRIQENMVVGFLSRFQPEKGAGVYIEVAKMYPQVIFLALAPNLNVYSLRELPENFIYAGRQPREILPLFFNAFDVHCLPSMVGEETFGLTVLEAMACGTPPVVPDFDGLPEVVGDAGIVVEASIFRDEIGSFAGYVSPAAMSQGINLLLNNEEERIKLGEKARQRALSFSWDESAKKILELFEKLNRKKKANRNSNPSVFFAPYLSKSERMIKYRSILTNLTENKENPLMFNAYPQSVEEGLALALLKVGHTLHEVETVLMRLCGDKEYRIFEGLEHLEKFDEMGLIFADKMVDASTGEDKRLRIYIPYSFSRYSSTMGVTDNLNNYCLLTSLSKHADIYVGCPKKEDIPEIDQMGIHVAPLEIGRAYSPVKYVVDECDGILLLSQHVSEDLVFFRCDNVPVINRIYSGNKDKDAINSLTFSSHAALRSFDSLSFDASWMKSFFSELITFHSTYLGFHVIPNGVDLENFKPMDKTLAKNRVAEAFDNADIMKKPFVGWISGFQPEKEAEILLRLADSNPQIIFILIESTLDDYSWNPPSNIVLFNIRDIQDKRATLFIFNAFDLFCFPAIPGTCSSMVIETMACGIPPIVIGFDNLPDEIGDAGILARMKRSGFDNVIVPIEKLSEKINFLLKDESERIRLGEKAVEKASLFTWENVSKEIVNLFRELNRRKIRSQENRRRNSFPVLFSHHYDKAQGTVESQALLMPSFSKQSVEEGLVLSLLEEHSMAEVETVLMHIFNNCEKVTDIIESAIGVQEV